MNGLKAIKHSLLYLLLIGAAWMDIREKRIPNWLLGAAWVFRILLFTAESFITETGTIVRGSMLLAGSILLMLGFSFFVLLSRNRLGFGDVKLLGTMALYQGVEKTLACLFYGLFIAAFISLPLLAAGKINRKDKLPLAPFFLMGYMCMLLWKCC